VLARKRVLPASLSGACRRAFAPLLIDTEGRTIASFQQTLDAIKEVGIEESTIIIFSPPNGEREHIAH